MSDDKTLYCGTGHSGRLWCYQGTHHSYIGQPHRNWNDKGSLQRWTFNAYTIELGKYIIMAIDAEVSSSVAANSRTEWICTHVVVKSMLQTKGWTIRLFYRNTSKYWERDCLSNLLNIGRGWGLFVKFVCQHKTCKNGDVRENRESCEYCLLWGAGILLFFHKWVGNSLCLCLQFHSDLNSKCACTFECALVRITGKILFCIVMVTKTFFGTYWLKMGGEGWQI